MTLNLAQHAQDGGDGETARTLFDEALGHAEQANIELRDLAQGILPSVLARGGLAASVEELVERLRLTVSIDVIPDRFRPEIEATAYFVVAEALTNLGQALSRSKRPYLEIGCLAHLAIAAPLSGLSASAALALSEEAVTIAEAHGLATNPIVALAFAIGAGSLPCWDGSTRPSSGSSGLGWRSAREEIRGRSWPCTTRAACSTPVKAGSRTRWPSSGTGRGSKGCSPARTHSWSTCARASC